MTLRLIGAAHGVHTSAVKHRDLGAPGRLNKSVAHSRLIDRVRVA